MRDDEALLANFDDKQNDALLFVAWTDLSTASGSSPVEAQVFQAWFYASYPEKLARREDAARFLSAFPRLNEMPRSARKTFLKQQIEVARGNSMVMDDPRTDQRPLVWSGSSE